MELKTQEVQRSRSISVVTDCRVWPPLEKFIILVNDNWVELCTGKRTDFEAMFPMMDIKDLVVIWKLSCWRYEGDGRSLLYSTYQPRLKWYLA